jgi:hypothetical protein
MKSASSSAFQARPITRCTSVRAWVLYGYPHHDELSAGEGLLTLHRIADKEDSRLAIATIALSDTKSVGMRLRTLLLGNAEFFDLAIR